MSRALQLSAFALLLVGCASDTATRTSEVPPAPTTPSDEMKAEDLPAPMPVSVQDVMRAKTAWSSSLLEAVAMRDYDLIQHNADALRRLSEEAAFIVQDTVTYRAYSEQFRTEVAALADAARRANQAQVETGYMRVTETCFRCHEYVRSERFHSQMPGRVSLRSRPKAAMPSSARAEASAAAPARPATG